MYSFFMVLAILLYLYFYHIDTAIFEEHFSVVAYGLFMCYYLSLRIIVLKQSVSISWLLL